MLTTIKGYYDHGKIILTEPPPVTEQTEVFVTFLTNNKPQVQLRKLGGFEGKISVPSDFNEPLEDLNEYM